MHCKNPKSLCFHVYYGRTDIVRVFIRTDARWFGQPIYWKVKARKRSNKYLSKHL